MHIFLEELYQTYIQIVSDYVIQEHYEKLYDEISVIL